MYMWLWQTPSRCSQWQHPITFYCVRCFQYITSNAANNLQCQYSIHILSVKPEAQIEKVSCPSDRTPKIQVQVWWIPEPMWFSTHYAPLQTHWHDHIWVRGQEFRWIQVAPIPGPHDATASPCWLKCKPPFLMPWKNHYLWREIL